MASSPGKSPSKRFSTTTQAALTGHSFNGEDVPGTAGDPLDHRIIKDKNRFQKGSISFGHEKVCTAVVSSMLSCDDSIDLDRVH